MESRVRLDYTANGAGLLIRRLFEAVGAFEEGMIPWRTTMGELFRSTGLLIETLMGLKNAPVMELEAVAVAFRQCMILWSDTHSPPRMTRKKYLKKIFDGEMKFCNKLVELHSAYLRIQIARGGKKRALSAADVMGDDSKGSSERLEIFRAIERIANKQKSVIKAIKILREGSYAARMRGIKSETWRRYYYDWERSKACSKILADTMAKNQGLYRHHDDVKCDDVGINVGINCENVGINVGINGTDVGINGVNVGINRSSKEENLVELIKLDGTLTAVRIAEMYFISTRQAERLINALKRKGIIYREGSNKTGVWKVKDSSN